MPVATRILRFRRHKNNSNISLLLGKSHSRRQISGVRW